MDSFRSSTPTVAHVAFDVARHAGWVWTVNGDRPTQDVEDYLSEMVSFEPTRGPCEYCGTVMSFVEYRGEPSQDRKDQQRYYALGFCPYCAHWTFQGYEGNSHCMDAPTTVVSASLARRFEPGLPEGCAAEMAQYFRQHPEAWHHVSPHWLETFVADVWRANHTGCEVKHVGKPGDLGTDVVFVDEGKQTWLIQVKRRTRAGRAEGFATLQSLLGTLALEGARHGIVVTTADYFSRQARRECRRASRQGFIIELVDKGVLTRMLSPVLPLRPWETLLRQPLFDVLDRDVVRYFADRVPNPAERSLFD